MGYFSKNNRIFAKYIIVRNNKQTERSETDRE